MSSLERRPAVSDRDPSLPRVLLKSLRKLCIERERGEREGGRQSWDVNSTQRGREKRERGRERRRERKKERVNWQRQRASMAAV
jgi:hypothetical protein